MNMEVVTNSTRTVSMRYASIIDDNYSTDVLHHLCVNVDVICMIT